MPLLLLQPWTTSRSTPAPMVPLAASVCQRIRVSAWPRSVVLVRVGMAVSEVPVGRPVPSTDQLAPLFVEIETVIRL